jgi:hypothetical protein
MSRTVLITGAGGNIGTKLCAHFSGLGWTLRLLDIDAHDYPAIQVADLADWDNTWVTLFDGVDDVIHLAGDPSPYAFWASIQRLNIAVRRHRGRRYPGDGPCAARRVAVTFLLDVNVLIALIDPAHVGHDSAQPWIWNRARGSTGPHPACERTCYSACWPIISNGTCANSWLQCCSMITIAPQPKHSASHPLPKTGRRRRAL